MKRKLIAVVATLVLAAGLLCSGWWLGYRDGVTEAYVATASELVSYHVAVKSGDSATAAKVIETLTGDSVSMLLDGRHSFPLYFENPHQANGVLSWLRAAWTPQTRRFGSQMRYPHRDPSSHDYAKEFEGIRAADSVGIAAKYRTGDVSKMP